MGGFIRCQLVEAEWRWWPPVWPEAKLKHLNQLWFIHTCKKRRDPILHLLYSWASSLGLRYSHPWQRKPRPSLQWTAYEKPSVQTLNPRHFQAPRRVYMLHVYFELRLSAQTEEQKQTQPWNAVALTVMDKSAGFEMLGHWRDDPPHTERSHQLEKVNT